MLNVYYYQLIEKEISAQRKKNELAIWWDKVYISDKNKIKRSYCPAHGDKSMKSEIILYLMMNVNFSFEAIKYNIIKFERFISMFNSFNNSFKQKYRVCQIHWYLLNK